MRQWVLKLSAVLFVVGTALAWWNNAPRNAMTIWWAFWAILTAFAVYVGDVGYESTFITKVCALGYNYSEAQQLYKGLSCWDRWKLENEAGAVMRQRVAELRVVKLEREVAALEAPVIPKKTPFPRAEMHNEWNTKPY